MSLNMTVNMETRPCVANGKPGIFHGFYQLAWTHGAAINIGGFPAGQEAYPVALVEFKDGTVETVRVGDIRFLDSDQYAFVGGEDETNE